jgi:hypothetical protein
MKLMYVVFAVLILITLGYCLWFTVPSFSATTDLGMYPDCAKHPDFGVIVRSSVDRKYYFIQSCTVADSAEGEDFRHEVPNKPCDVPELRCPKLK